MDGKPNLRRRLRIVHVLSEGRTSGIQQYVLELCAKLPRDRYKIELCFFGPGPLVPLAEQRGLRTAVIGWTNPNDMIAAMRFSTHLREHRVDILHAHQGWRRVRLLAKRSGVHHIVHHIHTLPSLSELAKRRSSVPSWLRSAISFCDACIAGSPFLHSQFITHSPKNEGKIFLILPGLDYERWADRPFQDTEEAKAAMGIPPDTPVIGTVARFVPVKRLDLFVDMAAAVRALRPQALFLICGDGEMRPAIEARAKALGVQGTVRFLGWRRDLKNVMSAFDLFAITSVEDVFAQSPLEPMAMGIPVVAFAAGSMSNWVEHGVTGLLTATGDIKALRDAVVSLIDQDKIRKRMGEAAQLRCKEQFDINLAARKIQDFYESLITNTP